jgi:hypothetical protein
MKVWVGFTAAVGEGCPSFGGQRTVGAAPPVFNARAKSARSWCRWVNRPRVATPNHSVKRTAPGVPGSAAYLKR